MADDNVTEIPQQNQKQPADPIESAAKKLRDGLAKEQQSKIDAQLKVTLEAYKVANKEKDKLQALIEESNESKSELADLLATLK